MIVYIATIETHDQVIAVAQTAEEARQDRMITVVDHKFRPYAAIPELCVEELAGSGDTCNTPAEHHLSEASTATLLELYEHPEMHDDDDVADAVLEELHERAIGGGGVAAREVLNDHDRDEPGFTPQTGSETR